MALNPERREEGTTDDYDYYGSHSTDELAATSASASASALARGAGEMMVIQTLQRLIRPIFIPIFRPLIRQFVKEEFELAKREILTSTKENPDNNACTSVLKRLKLQFRNRVALPVFTGMPLLGENQKPIEIALVDALTEQIVNTGTESTAHLEIMGFRDGDDDGCWTFEQLQERILSGKKGRRILQGETCLQLKEGIGFISKLSFTHTSEHTKNGNYRLGAIVVDAAWMNQVEVAWTETFVLKDRRHTYHEKHPNPRLSDKVCHLQQISYKGTRFKLLKKAEVITVKDLLTLFYTDPKQLEDILELKASSKIWDDIIKNAHASNGLFLYLDPGNKCKTGVVLDVKLQLKALIVEPQQYISVNHLSDQQKVDSQSLVKFASEHFKVLQSFEDETSLREYIQSGTGFTSSPSATNQSLGTSKITEEPTTPSSQITYSSCGLTESINNSNFLMGQSTNHTPNLTSQSERGKEKVPLGDERIYSANYYQEHISLHSPNLEGPNWVKFGADAAHNATEPGTSSQSVESLLDTCEFINTQIYSPNLEDFEEWLQSNDYSTHLESPNIECHSKPTNSDTDVVVLAAQTVSVCTIARTRWTKVSKLLRRNSVRERISLSEGTQAPKRQRCC